MTSNDDQMPDEPELTRFSPAHEVNGEKMRNFEIDRCGSTGKKEQRKVNRPFFVPALFGFDAEMEDDDDSIVKVYFELNWLQRLFVTLEIPNSSLFAEIVSTFFLIIIVISCLQYMLSTVPQMKFRPDDCPVPACDNDPDLCPDEVICEPQQPIWFEYVEIICVGFFTIDYVLRVATVWLVPLRLTGTLPKMTTESVKHHVIDIKDNSSATMTRNDSMVSDVTRGDDILLYDTSSDVEWPAWKCVYKYCALPMNIVDIAAIVPFYIELITASGSSIAIIRILRLARVFRILKSGNSKEGIRLLSRTVWTSFPALSLLAFFTAIGVVLFASLIFFCEAGEFTVNSMYPDGEYLRFNIIGDAKEISPFTSIPLACYWVVVTATTVGYGDLVPTSGAGRLVAAVCMYCGVLVLALPISVIGSNFSREYDAIHGADNDTASKSDEKTRKKSITSDSGSPTLQSIRRNITRQTSKLIQAADPDEAEDDCYDELVAISQQLQVILSVMEKNRAKRRLRRDS